MKKLLIISSLLLTTTNLVNAQENGLYFGLGMVASDINLGDDYQNADFAAITDPTNGDTDAQTMNLDGSDSNGAFTIGYKLNDTWAFELGYMQTEVDSEREIQANGAPAFMIREYEASLDANHFSFAPVYTIYRQDEWNIYGKAFVTYTDFDYRQGVVDEQFDIEAPIAGTFESWSDSKLGYGAAIGAEHILYKNLSATVEARYFANSIQGTAQGVVGLIYRL